MQSSASVRTSSWASERLGSRAFGRAFERVTSTWVGFGLVPGRKRPKSNTSLSTIQSMLFQKERPLNLNNMSDEKKAHNKGWYDTPMFILTSWINTTIVGYLHRRKRQLLFIRHFFIQEFNAIKKRKKLQHAEIFLHCHSMTILSDIVLVKKEAKNVKRTVLKSVVGTLDLSIQEQVKAPLFRSIHITSQNRYGYIANVCVAKLARRQGIACNMLHFAIEIAISDGVEQVYVYVHRHNNGAQDLYHNPQLEKEQTLLLCLKTLNPFDSDSFLYIRTHCRIIVYSLPIKLGC
ncbi:hypothetical protein UlMin_021952 [Ulmus minor]